MTGRFGMGNSRASTLNELDVVEIREKYWQQGFTQGALARLKGVTVGTIGRVVRGETWQHVGGAGMHKAATESPAAMNVRDAAREKAALETPMSLEALASLARLQQMMAKTDDQKEEDKEDENAD